VRELNRIKFFWGLFKDFFELFQHTCGLCWNGIIITHVRTYTAGLGRPSLISHEMEHGGTIWGPNYIKILNWLCT